MGLEMVLLLVDTPVLNHLLATPWSALQSGMEKGAFREHRPAQDTRLKRVFAIDAEAELLDWMETCSVEGDPSVLEAFRQLRDGEEGLLHLMHYASPGAWEVWEGRAFLYLDVALGKAVPHVDALYSEDTWNETCSRLTGIAEEEFASSVCIDWMQRRKALGETLDEKEDPKIVPTYEAHDRASRTLVHAINTWSADDNLVGIIGREHLRAAEWGHGAWNLSAFLNR